MVVSQGPTGLTHWGPWQFPSVERLADGRLHVSFHIEADSATAYGLPVGHAVSSDNGHTWQAVKDTPLGGGLLLPNGDRLRSISLRSRPLAELTLPAPIATRGGTYGSKYNIYALASLPPELRDGWRFSRCRAGQTEWVEETATVHMPGEIRYSDGSVFTFPWMWRMTVAPDGSLWAFIYPWRAPGGVLREKWLPVFLRSTDYGHTWDMQSEIAYKGDPAADAAWDKRDGFTEPNIAFMPDGSLFALLRTTDGNGIGPMYACSSPDGGKTWSTPQVFDNLGVWPALITLKNGVTLTAYGRPGVYVRATSDPAGREWTGRVTVVEPGVVGKDSCSYCDLLAMDDDTALLAYSHFTWPNAQGQPCKTIMVRTVKTIA
jgi:hypothetical protein